MSTHLLSGMCLVLREDDEHRLERAERTLALLMALCDGVTQGGKPLDVPADHLAAALDSIHADVAAARAAGMFFPVRKHADGASRITLQEAKGA